MCVTSAVETKRLKDENGGRLGMMRSVKLHELDRDPIVELRIVEHLYQSMLDCLKKEFLACVECEFRKTSKSKMLNNEQMTQQFNLVTSCGQLPYSVCPDIKIKIRPELFWNESIKKSTSESIWSSRFEIKPEDYCVGPFMHERKMMPYRRSKVKAQSVKPEPKDKPKTKGGGDW